MKCKFIDFFGQTKDMAAAYSGLAKGVLTYFEETFVLRMNFSAKNPALHQARNH
jgi:hypothetical protein